MSKISVIVPVYNKEKYLSECINSILENTYKDIEIICVNDGSTDRSLELLNEFYNLDSRIKIYSQKNKGLAAARNYGIEKATSEFLMFIDADDFIDKNTFESIIPHLDNNDLIIYGIKITGDYLQEKRAEDDLYYKLKFQGKTIITDEFLLNTDVSSCNKVFRKSVIKDNKLSYPEGFYYEDANFFYKYVSCIDSAYFINKAMYSYRRHSDSIMANTFRGDAHAIHHILIFKDIYNFLKHKNFISKHAEVTLQLFENFFWFSFNYSPLENKLEVLSKTYEIASLVFSDNYWKKSGLLYNNKELFLHLFERLFSFSFNYLPRDYKIKLIIKSYRMLYSIFSCKLNNSDVDSTPFIKRILNKKNYYLCNMLCFFNFIKRLIM